MQIARRTFLASALGAAASATASAAARTAPTKDTKFIVAAVAPLNKSLQIDEGLTKAYLAFLADSGVDGVLANGTTGEFASFSTAERRRMLEVFLKHKGPLTVMTQVGATNQSDAIELIRHAAGSGADSVLVLPPFYFNQPSDDGLVAFLEPILDASELPTLLYNIPQVSEVELTLTLVQRLYSHERLWGIKDSWGKLERTTEYIQQFPRLNVLTGAAGLISKLLPIGGAGALTGNGNVLPRETAAILQAFRTGGDMAAAQRTLDERGALLRGYTGVAAYKSIFAAMGVGRMYVRPPFTDLTAGEERELIAKLKDAGVL